MSLTEKVIDKKKLQLEYAFEQNFDIEGRVITLEGDIEEGCFSWFNTCMDELERINRKTIFIKINTFGGSIYESNAIIGRIQESTCMTITKGYGKIMSAGLLILASGKKRQMSKYATGMHHSIGYDLGYDKHHEQRNWIVQAEKEEILRFKIFEEFTGIKASIWKKMADSKVDKYLSAQECLDLNIVDDLF